MWVMRKMQVLFLCILFLLPVIFVPQSQGSTHLLDSSTLYTASLEANRRFGDGSTPSFVTTFYDIEGKPAAHLFLVTKDQGSPLTDMETCLEEGRAILEEGEALIQAGETEEGQKLIVRGKSLLFQEDRYGTLIVSAAEEGSSLVAFHHGLPTYLVAKTEVRERAEDFSNGRPVTWLGVLYLSPLEYYVECEVDGQRILVSPLNLDISFRVDLDDDFNVLRFEAPEEYGQAPPDDVEEDHDVLQDGDQNEISPVSQYPDSLIIAGVPDYNQPASLSNSCGPTAGACLLGYWDTEGYDGFVQGAGTPGDVTLLIDELCEAMNWNPISGVYYSQVPLGLQRIIDGRQYVFGISNGYGIYSLDLVRQEIAQGRPFIYGSQENPWGVPHYVVVVGYDGNFIVAHDNWWSTPTDYFVNWNALGHGDDMMTTLIPGGSGTLGSLPSDVGGSGGGCFITAIHP
jgi:hypothetical protein